MKDVPDTSGMYFFARMLTLSGFSNKVTKEGFHLTSPFNDGLRLNKRYMSKTNFSTKTAPSSQIGAANKLNNTIIKQLQNKFFNLQKENLSKMPTFTSRSEKMQIIKK